MLDLPLIRRAWDKAKNSAEYDQLTWRCGTKMCLAGFIAFEGGWKWRSSSLSPFMEKEGFHSLEVGYAARLAADLDGFQASYLFSEERMPDEIEDWISSHERIERCGNC